MRIISCGPLRPDPARLDEWMSSGDSETAESARAEAEMAWGFVAETDEGEILDAEDISYPSASHGFQMAYQLQPLGELQGFFLHGYRPGDAIYLKDAFVDAVTPTEIDPKFGASYVPPSLTDLPGVEVNPLPKFEWYCLRCRETVFTLSEAFAAGSQWAAFSDNLNTPFTVVTCAACGFSEFYAMRIGQFRGRWNLEAYEISE